MAVQTGQVEAAGSPFSPAGLARADEFRAAPVLVVEEDDEEARAILRALNSHGFDAIRSRRGRAALELLDARTAMVLLDLTLPDLDGFEVCWRIRRASDVPVIMVSGHVGVDARIRGLELGADDFVIKPYEPRELVARVEAVLRRRRACADESVHASPLWVRGIRIDLSAREVTFWNGRHVPLTRKEFDLLAFLARRRGSVVARERLLRAVWGSGWKGLERTLEVHIASLRRKLGPQHTVIETVRGFGYRMATNE